MKLCILQIDEGSSERYIHGPFWTMHKAECKQLELARESLKFFPEGKFNTEDGVIYDEAGNACEGIYIEWMI